MLGPKAEMTANYLDLLSLSQRVTAANIANADTPGYRTLGFDFQAEFRRLLEQPRSAAAPPRVEPVGGLQVKNDGNDVGLDRELKILSENGIRFAHALLMLRGTIGAVRSAIREGR